MRVLGIDTSLRSTGVGVIEAAGSRISSVEYGVIKTPAGRPHSECLARLDEQLRSLIARTKPDAASIEGIFFCKNVKVAVILGEARGVVIAACSVAGIPIFEYAPRRVKQAIVGYGGAHKTQVGKMIMAMLGLPTLPPPDATDALAMAICHWHHSNRISALKEKPL